MEAYDMIMNLKQHWKRNSLRYLEEYKKMKGSETSTSSVFVIEVNLSTPTSWVLDTRYGSHICTNVQKLNSSKSLAKGKLTYELEMEQKLLPWLYGLMY